MAKTKLETLSIDLLRLDGGTQARIKTHEDAVDDYAEVITNEGGDWPFDPIDVFHDGSDYFVADGFHRTLAAIRVKRASIPCRVHQGTSKDAKIFGMTANDTHGLRMSREDKRACVEWLLDNGGKMTQEQIAETAGVTSRTVRNIVADRDSKNRKVSGSANPSSKSSEAPKPTDAEKLKKKKEKEAAKAKKKADADAAKAAKKAEADAARAEKKKQAEAEKLKKKEQAAKDRAAAKEAKDKAALQALPADEAAQKVRSIINQLISKAMRSAGDLNEIKPNRTKYNAFLKAMNDIQLW